MTPGVNPFQYSPEVLEELRRLIHPGGRVHHPFATTTFAVATCCRRGRTKTTGAGMTIEDVMARHFKAIAARDVDAVVADYGDDSVIMSPGRTVRGLSEIRELFAGLFTDFISAGSKLDGTWQAIHGEYVFVVWEGESAKQRFPIGTDTFLVRDDKIVFQTFVAHVVDK